MRFRLAAEHALTLNNLGLACLRAKQYDAAIQHLAMSVALWEQVRGPGALDVGLTANNLGEVYEAAGRLAEAESQMRRALAIAEKSLGPASLRTAEILRSYAQVLRKLHRKSEAAEMLARADRIFHDQAREQPARQSVDAADLASRPR
jgi:tetratricopeptide (TPR) repeat protein